MNGSLAMYYITDEEMRRLAEKLRQKLQQTSGRNLRKSDGPAISLDDTWGDYDNMDTERHCR